MVLFPADEPGRGETRWEASGSCNDIDDLVEEDDHDGDEDITRGVGTRLYAAPEQLASDDYDEKADVYSLGVVLYELLRPRFGTTMERVTCISRIARASPAERLGILRTELPHIDIGVLDLVSAALARDARAAAIRRCLQSYWGSKKAPKQLVLPPRCFHTAPAFALLLPQTISALFLQCFREPPGLGTSSPRNHRKLEQKQMGNRNH